MRKTRTAVLVLGLLCSGCGSTGNGGDGRADTQVTANSYPDFERCLLEHGVSKSYRPALEPARQQLGKAAGIGSVVFDSDAQVIQVVVERSVPAATRTAAAFRALGGPEGTPARIGNVVVAYTETPNADDEATIDACL